jgi:hypothetical protein
MLADLLAGIVQSTNRQLTAAMASARLYYNYLRLSPSYAAGCIHRLRKKGRKLNSHGQRVLACVDKYGDVHETSFADWVSGPGRSRAVVPAVMPELMTAKSLKIGHQSDLFIRFPNGANAMPQLQFLAWVSAIVPSVAREYGGIRLTPVMQKNLWRDVYLAYLLKNYPEAELWRLGAEAMLVDRFIGKVEPTGRRMNSSQDYERRLLVATVVRHRAWAANISEHAAIDEFPCKEGLPNQQHCLDLGTVDLLSQLGSHSREESLHARAQVIRCTGAAGRVSPEPSFKHQGVLF